MSESQPTASLHFGRTSRISASVLALGESPVCHARSPCGGNALNATTTCRLIWLTAALFTFASAHAEVLDLEGTVKAVDATARTITIERKTPKGTKTLELEVTKKAGDLSSVKAGDSISFSYDPDLEFVTNIGGAAASDLSAPFDLAAGSKTAANITTLAVAPPVRDDLPPQSLVPRYLGNAGVPEMRAEIVLAILLTSVSVVTAALGSEKATGSSFTATDVESFVAYHNKTRAAVGVPPVEWSPEIAAYAQKWADRLAATGELEHRPVEGEWARIYGENLAIDSSIVAGAESWHSEQKDYPKVEPIPSDFSGFTAGHYTQMVWRKTKRIGAGVAVVKQGRFKGMTVVVCNYDPPGNMIGEKPY